MKRIIAGPRAVTEALRSHADTLAVIYLSKGYSQKKTHIDIINLASKKKVCCEECRPEKLDALVPDHRHQHIIAIAGEYPYLNLDTLLSYHTPFPQLLLALDQVTDPHNLGAIIRSAVAFGAEGIIILRVRAAPINHTVVRASAGATEHAHIARITNLARTLHLLQQNGMQIVGLDGCAQDDIGSLPDPTHGRVLVIGSEGKGLRRLTRESCEHLVRIPLSGPISSLNASVAAGIALYESSLAMKRIPEK